MPLKSEIPAGLSIAVEAARRKPDFLSAVAETLAEAQREVEKLSPHCLACGKCCRFDEMDHRLFVSTGELALLTVVSRYNPPAELRCRFQGGDECFARQNRPLGCRLFFCDPELSEGIHGIYEKFHAGLVELHRRFGVEYFYWEMTSAFGKISD